MENFLQFWVLAVVFVPWPGGHVPDEPVKDDVSNVVFCIVTRPAAWGQEEVVDPGWMQFWLGALDRRAPMVSDSTPEDAVVSFEMIVLLMRSTSSASCNETPAPSQPATLFAMALFVTVTWCPWPDVRPFGKKPMFVPSTSWNRRPPPLP